MFEVGEIIKLIKKIKKLDYYILIPVLLLSAIGIVMVYSSSSYLAAEMNNLQYHFRRQIAYVIVGLFFLFITYVMNHQLIKKTWLIGLAYFITVGLLITVLIVGDEVNGARAWLNLGFFQVQPAEIAKVAIIMLFADYYSRNAEKAAHGFMKTMIKPVTALFVVLGLIFIQPDVGSASIIALTSFVIILASGIPWKKSLSLLFGAMLLFVSLFLIIKTFGESLPLIQPYQLERFRAFFDPFSLSETAGHQLVNSYYALSRGGITGVGLGNSVQKSGYLPEPHTDFIMAIIAEELGLIMVLVIITLFFFLIIRIYIIAIRAKDTYNSLLCLGVASLFFIQASVNLAGVVGLLPITGVTFPFISFGGSSMIMSLIAVGLVLNVSLNERQLKEKERM